MKCTIKLCLISLFLIALTSCNKENPPNYLTGTVTDPGIQSILLTGVNQDLRFDSIIKIPVDKGEFRYEFDLDKPMAFDLMLGSAKENGGGRFMPIFLHDSDVKLIIYGEEDFEKNEVTGEELNEEYGKFRKRIDSVSNNNPNFKFTDELTLWNSYIEKNSSIVSYYLFLNSLLYFQDFVDIEEAKKNYYSLSQSNDQHPYNEMAKNLLDAMEDIRIGNDFVDFSAPDINGEKFRFSEQIRGKIALLNLWATWCRSCIEKSRKIVPIYEQYKEEGFTMVNVAGEFRDTKSLEKFYEKEKWPGKHLVELDRRNHIWLKYGVDGGGGGMFLIDQEGKLIAINPGPEEMRNELEKRLNQ